MKNFDDLKQQLSEGRINRRDFIKRTSALGLAAAIPSALLTQEAVASTPKSGGRLIQALRGGSLSDSLDGAKLIDTHGVNVSWQLRNNMTEVKADGSLVGEVVEDDWDASSDASQWIFKVKKDVEFHNGKTLDAEDIIFSINHHRGEDSGSGGSGAVTGIKDIRADGKDTVIFDLKSGNSDFPFLMADYHLTIVPAGTTNFDEGIGTGPYKLKLWDAGVTAETVRNPNYHKDGLPYFDEVETINMLDVQARMSAVQTGEVHCIEEPDLKTVAFLGKQPGITIKEAPGNKHFNYPMMTTRSPYDNNHVRMALKYSMDREVMLKTLLGGHGYLGNDHPIGRRQRYFDKDLEQRSYDPDKAKWHLEQAGLSSLDITLDAADVYPGAVDGAVLFKEHAAVAGININVNRVPTDGFWDEVWLKSDFCTSYWSGRATEDWMFSTAYDSASEWNDMGPWKNEKFDKLLLEARSELDETKRATLYHEMQRIVRDDSGSIIPIFASWVMALSDKLGTADKLAGNWVMDGNKNTERWWFV
jgi:peptide/nickel transport system substrate-binding protein